MIKPSDLLEQAQQRAEKVAPQMLGLHFTERDHPQVVERLAFLRQQSLMPDVKSIMFRERACQGRRIYIDTDIEVDEDGRKVFFAIRIIDGRPQYFCALSKPRGQPPVLNAGNFTTDLDEQMLRLYEYAVQFGHAPRGLPERPEREVQDYLPGMAPG